MTNQEAADELQYAIDLIKQDGKDWLDERDIPVLEVAISALQAQDLQSTCNQLATDTISKQAAIEEWKNDFKGYVNALNIPRDDYNGIMEYIDELPSAQPDRSCIDQIKWERDIAIQQLNELGYSFGEAIRHDKDVISRKGAINAVCTVLYPDSDKMNDAKKVLKEMPSAKPEYYDYSDIEPLWKSFAEENDINLTDTAKQLKDAMWCGYRKGKADAQPEQRWIPCSERLPEELGDYLVSIKRIGWNYEEYVENDIAYWDDLFHKADKVIAWMPLPEPYEGEQE